MFAFNIDSDTSTFAPNTMVNTFKAWTLTPICWFFSFEILTLDWKIYQHQHARWNSTLMWNGVASAFMFLHVCVFVCGVAQFGWLLLFHFSHSNSIIRSIQPTYRTLSLLLFDCWMFSFHYFILLLLFFLTYCLVRFCYSCLWKIFTCFSCADICH